MVFNDLISGNNIFGGGWCLFKTWNKRGIEDPWLSRWPAWTFHILRRKKAIRFVSHRVAVQVGRLWGFSTLLRWSDVRRTLRVGASFSLGGLSMISLNRYGRSSITHPRFQKHWSWTTTVRKDCYYLTTWVELIKNLEWLFCGYFLAIVGERYAKKGKKDDHHVTLVGRLTKTED